MRDRLCGLKEKIRPDDCVDALLTALECYDTLMLNMQHAESSWEAPWLTRLPPDLLEVLRAWSFPSLKPSPSGADAMRVASAWHPHLERALEMFCEADAPNRKVLAGFNLVNDVIFSLGTEAQFERLWNSWQGAKLDDMLTCLAESINDPARHGKFRPSSGELDRIWEGADDAQLRKDQFVGGAPANMAYVLGHMGIEVHMHCPYPDAELEWQELAASVSYLPFEGNKHQPPRPLKRLSPNPALPFLPLKTTVGIAWFPGSGWRFQRSGFTVHARRPGRALFIGKYPRSHQDRAWKRVKVTKVSRYWEGGWSRDARAWPYPTLFCNNLEVNGRGTLVITPVDSGAIEQLAKEQRHDLALIKDVSSTGHDRLDQAKKAQLDALRRAGIPIHTELSAGFDFSYLKRLVSGSPHDDASYWSGGLNHDELPGVADSVLRALQYREATRHPPLVSPLAGPADLLQRFFLAYHTVQLLGLDWLYVHGNELDLAIWRPRACSRFQDFGTRLRDAMLLAKAAVVAAMIERTRAPAHRQQAEEQLGQQAALAPKGLIALLAFARDFSEWVHKWAEDSAGLQLDKKDVRDRLCLDGSWESEESFGVAVAPVFWPDLARYLNATGAGDFSSAVTATYGWK